MILRLTLLANTLASAALVAATPFPYSPNRKWILRQESSSLPASVSVPSSTPAQATTSDSATPATVSPTTGSSATSSITAASSAAVSSPAGPIPTHPISLRYNERWAAWTTKVDLGNQSFDVQVDLQSSVLAVSSSRCKDIYSCLGRPLFEDFKERDNIVDNSTISTVDRGLNMEGWQYRLKSIKLGNFTFEQQNFLALDELPDSPAFNAFAGVLGLGLPNATSDAANATVVKLDGTQIGLQLTASEYTTSELNIGGPNPAKFNSSDIETHSVDDSGMWQLPNVIVNMGGKSKTGITTRFSTTTRGIWGPAESVADLYSSIPGAARWPSEDTDDDTPTSWVVPCAKKSMTSMTLSFSWDNGNRNWPVKRPALWEIDEGMCLGTLAGYPANSPWANSTVWVLGHMWMESAYHAFDVANKTITIAKLTE